MDVGLAIWIGFAALVVPIALDQHDQNMENLPKNGWRNTMLGRGIRPKIRRKPALIGITLAVIAWAILIPLSLAG